MMQPQRVFLAHAREDKNRIRTLYKQLKQRGFSPWLDEEDLIPGQIWEIEIQKVIREAGVFIACLSQVSVRKQGFMQTEFRLALTAYGEKPPGAIYFIPVRLDECEIPDLQIPSRGLRIRDFHWLDLWQEDGFERLIRALEKGLGASGRAMLKPGTVFRDIDALWCPKMVVLPAGTFLMGSPEEEIDHLQRKGALHYDSEGRIKRNSEGRIKIEPFGPFGHYDREGPQHRVKIEPFAIGKTEVTFAEWDACVTAAGCNGYKPPDQGWGRGSRPVVNVSWKDAKAYVSWLSKQTGEPYRLPSEAEWEYAARAGTTTRYAFGDAITPKDANYGESKLGKTTEVDAYPPNAWGLYDMHGNVSEWVEDVWHDSYRGAPTNGSAWTNGEGENSSRDRVVRGGAWNKHPVSLRSAARQPEPPDIRDFKGHLENLVEGHFPDIRDLKGSFEADLIRQILQTCRPYTDGFRVARTLG